MQQSQKSETESILQPQEAGDDRHKPHLTPALGAPAPPWCLLHEHQQLNRAAGWFDLVEDVGLPLRKRFGIALALGRAGGYQQQVGGRKWHVGLVLPLLSLWVSVEYIKACTQRTDTVALL